METKDSSTEKESDNPTLSKKQEASSLQKTLRQKKLKKTSKSSRTLRGTVTSYGAYHLVPIDFVSPSPDNECYRIQGFFEYSADSPASPIPSTSRCCWDNAMNKNNTSLLAVSTPCQASSKPEVNASDTNPPGNNSIGIDITTNDFILNNIGIPGHSKNRDTSQHIKHQSTPQAF